MRVRLGINTCFAVKRWPRAEDWAPIVRDRLGLELVQHSLDLDESPPAWLDPVAAGASGPDDRRPPRPDSHSTFTGLAAYSRNLLLHPRRRRAAAALAWFGGAIA